MNNTDADFGLVELDWIDHDAVRFLRLLLCRRMCGWAVGGGVQCRGRINRRVVNSYT